MSKWLRIIDWGFSTKVPFEQAACFPRLLRLQNLELPPSLVLQKDREYYIASVQYRKTQEIAWMIHVLSARNADFRARFLKSIVSRGMDRRLASNGWRIPCEDASNEGSIGRST